MRLDPFNSTLGEYKERYGETWLKEFTKDKRVKEKKSSYKDIYYREVRYLTENSKHLIENITLRGYRTYHIDHKIPISIGYKRKIPPEVISHPSNLTMLWWEDNIEKKDNTLVDKHNKWIEERYL